MAIDWFKLYKENPKEFEKQRIQHIGKAIIKISGGDHQRLVKLKQYQWRIEKELHHYKGVARYNKMVEMFWFKVNELQEKLKCL